jgi:ABC-type amino acid transport substrate-binding protein
MGVPLRIGVYEAPPFALYDADGTWDGVSVELIRSAARRLNRPVTFERVDAQDPLAALGQVDLVLAPQTAAGEARADFVTPHYTASLGVAKVRTDGAWSVVERLFSPLFLKMVLVLAVLLLLVGAAVWAFEKKENDEEFRPDWRGGLWDAFWWSGVTMSTIGYGDKAPRSVGGRTLALLWMLVSMGITAALTAALVSALGLGTGTGSGSAELPGALRDARVGVLAGSAATDYVDRERVRATPFADLAAGLDALESDSLDVFVASAPLLTHHLQQAESRPNVQVTSTGAEPVRWAFAVPEGSALQEPLTRATLAVLDEPTWPQVMRRYVTQ